MSSSGKMKKNLDKIKNRCKKLNLQLASETEKVNQKQENLDRLAQKVRDIKNDNQQLQTEYDTKVKDFELIRKNEQTLYDKQLEDKNVELYNLRQLIEEYNRQAEEEAILLDKEQREIEVTRTQYKTDIKRAKIELDKLRSDLQKHECPTESTSNLVISKLLEQIDQREKKERLSKQIEALTSLRNNLELEIQNLGKQIGEIATDPADSTQQNSTSNPPAKPSNK